MSMKWETVGKLKVQMSNAKVGDVVDVLLANRGLITNGQRDEFFAPISPKDIDIAAVGLKQRPIAKVVERIKIAKEKNEKVLIYGDYDADGICATAILWECLYEIGIDVVPYIPERFDEGYGLNSKSVEKIEKEYKGLKLIITVDNGIVAHGGSEKCTELGIDLVITDHHEQEDKKPKAVAIIHSQKVGGAGISWILSREVRKEYGKDLGYGLELAAIGTLSDQIPLIGANRSIVKYGIEDLNVTVRPGFLAMFTESAIERGSIGTYQIGFVIAPRINAMGRLEHAIDSLRLVCTKSKSRASELASHLGKVNRRRQKIVQEVMIKADKMAEETKWKGAIMIADADYHEGVIGLAASKLVKKYYRPAIVFSKGEKVSKASGRSIPGFNLIEAIRKMDDFLEAGGGHPMAVGFSIKTKRLGEFIEKFSEVSEALLGEDILVKKMKVDVEVDFNVLSWELLTELGKFSPVGMGNSAPSFMTRGVTVLDSKAVGKERSHLKMKLQKEGKVFDAIGFKFGGMVAKLLPGTMIRLVYNFEENFWNGTRSMQLKVKDIKLQSD